MACPSSALSIGSQFSSLPVASSRALKKFEIMHFNGIWV